jgi:hypothetical protein
MTFTNMSKSTTVPIETSGGSCRFKRLKLYARTITKSGKEKRNVCQSSFSAAYVTNNYYRLLRLRPKRRFVTHTRCLRHTNFSIQIKSGRRKFDSEPEFLFVLPPKEPNNFDVLVKRNFEASRYSLNHLSPPSLSPKSAEETPIVKNRRAGERSNIKSPQLGGFSVGSQSSLFPLSNAFRETAYSDSDSIPAWALPQQLSDSPKPIQSVSDISISPPMSPSFLNPRQAPHPPPVELEDPDLTVISAASVATGGKGNSCAATIASSDSAQSSKYDASTAEGQLPAFLASPSPSGLPKPLPSTGSGLERIGAALLGYGHSSNDDCLLTSSCSSLDAHGMDDQSLGSLLDTMETYGTFVRELSQSHTSESVATFVLPSLDSAPANLADSSFSLNDSIASNSRNFPKNMRVKSLLRASFTETLSNLEQLLQDQGVTVPSSRNMVELWQALSMGASRDSFTASRAIETVHPIARRDLQGTAGSLLPIGMCLSALPNHIKLERIEGCCQFRSQDQNRSVSDPVQDHVLVVQTEPVTSDQEPLLFEEGDSQGPKHIGIAI